MTIRDETMQDVQIKGKIELNFFIQADYMMNRGKFKRSFKDRLVEILFPDNIARLLKFMRKFQYYSYLQKGIGVKRFYYGIRFHKLSRKLGFSIGKSVFDYGLVIPHYGTIVVGGNNRIGKYAVLHTSTCIADNEIKIGDGLYLSTGAKITSKTDIGNNVMVAANSVVSKGVKDGDVLLAGMPAKIKAERTPWYESSEKYKQRVQAVEKLKIQMGIG